MGGASGGAGSAGGVDRRPPPGGAPPPGAPPPPPQAAAADRQARGGQVVEHLGLAGGDVVQPAAPAAEPAHQDAGVAEPVAESEGCADSARDRVFGNFALAEYGEIGGIPVGRAGLLGVVVTVIIGLTVFRFVRRRTDRKENVTA